MHGDNRLTLSVFQADVGGFIGHVTTHPEILNIANERLSLFRDKGVIADFHVLRCGSEFALAITHYVPPGSTKVRDLAFNVISACTEAALELKLLRDPGLPPRTARKDDPHGIPYISPGPAGGEPRGPCIVEMDFVERDSEPVIILLAAKTLAGSWNLPLYKVFSDPFNTTGLLSDPEMFSGFSFTVLDLADDTEMTLSAPADTYSLLALVSESSRYVITRVKRTSGAEAAAAVSVREVKRSGRCAPSGYNPVAVFRCHSGFPSVGETLEPFSLPYLVGGRLSETHSAPLMPVPFYEATPTRFNGPPRMIGAGFQITNGRMVGPHDMFDDPGFDASRRLAGTISDYLRRHGPFEPHPNKGVDRRGGFEGILEKIRERSSR